MSDLIRLRRGPDKVSAPGAPSDHPIPPDGPVAVRTPVGTNADVPPRGLVYIETYGCQMNIADSEMALGLMGAAGFARTEEPTQADVILINTCAVREKAEERVFGRVGNLVALKAGRPGLVVGITGCMAEHLRDKLQEQLPAVDLIIGPDAYRRLVEHVDNAKAGKRITDTVLDKTETYEGIDAARGLAASGGVVGHVTIQRGCDKFCTFCVVPLTRGRERGTPPREILRQVRDLASAGYKEVQLLGQTVNSYVYEDVTFADLLRSVAQVDGIQRVRFTSPYPLDFSPAVIEAMAASPKICKHVHLPLQSGSDAVLERMRRGYNFRTFMDLVVALRTAMPDIAITTDLLVGFCGETEAEFDETLRATTNIRFDSAFTFTYSEREGTYAARKMPNDIPEAVKVERLQRLIAIQRQISAEIMATQVGRRERILIETVSKRSNAEYLGRTDGFRSVIVPGDASTVRGAFVHAQIQRANAATLFGQVVP